jgi:hypothetical protein
MLSFWRVSVADDTTQAVGTLCTQLEPASLKLAFPGLDGDTCGFIRCGAGVVPCLAGQTKYIYRVRDGMDQRGNLWRLCQVDLFCTEEFIFG